MKIIGSVISLALVVLSSSTFANKIIITGEPVALDKQGEVYYTPKGYSATTDYHYVTVEGTKRVCFLEKRADLASLDVLPVRVQQGENNATWNCYPFNETFFEVTP